MIVRSGPATQMQTQTQHKTIHTQNKETDFILSFSLFSVSFVPKSAARTDKKYADFKGGKGIIFRLINEAAANVKKSAREAAEAICARLCENRRSRMCKAISSLSSAPLRAQPIIKIKSKCVFFSIVL